MASHKPITIDMVVRRGDDLVVPQKMSYSRAKEIIEFREAYEAEPVTLRDRIPVFSWDGALAALKAMKEIFHEFFAVEGSQVFNVKSSPTDTIEIPWGRFKIPGMSGYIEFESYKESDGRVCFGLKCRVMHTDEDKINFFFQRVRQIAVSESLYRGKAISVAISESFFGTNFPDPSFMDLTTLIPIFSRSVETKIERSILTPIRHFETCLQSNAPIKRGVLLHGAYGTGKTLCAAWIAQECVKHGWTFIYVKDTDDIAQVLIFAQQFMPAVVFCEDIDRVVGSARDDAANEILNTIDGIDTKDLQIVTVLTTNHIEKINEAMHRHGRLDAKIHVFPPDADTVIRLIKFYGSGFLEKDIDLSDTGQKLAGSTPSLIRETIERAKLEAIRRTGGISATLISHDLEVMADEILTEQNDIPQPLKELSMSDRFAMLFGEKIAKSLSANMIRWNKGAEKAGLS